MGKKSGTKCSAVSPTAPEKAQEADTADPGEVTEVKARQRQTQTGKYGAKPGKPYKPPAAASAAGAGPAASQAGAGSEDAGAEAPAAWIEIELVGEDDRPIPGARYRITLPDGETVDEGTLDSNGWARVEGIDEGTCKVSFPDLDAEAWEFVDVYGPR